MGEGEGEGTAIGMYNGKKFKEIKESKIFSSLNSLQTECLFLFNESKVTSSKKEKK